MSQKKFIIDADTGSDDAVAILMALRDPRVEVLGVHPEPLTLYQL